MPQTDAEPAASLARAAEAAACALRESRLVDATRIAIMGQSYGGYTALCALTATNCFKAGIVNNGVYDLLQAALNGGWGWVETGQGRMHAPPWEQPSRYVENSPVYAIHKLQAPLLILQGGEDDPGKGSQALFGAAQRAGKQAEWLTYRACGHGATAWPIEAQRDLHRRLLDFLREHLTAATHEPDSAHR